MRKRLNKSFSFFALLLSFIVALFSVISFRTIPTAKAEGVENKVINIFSWEDYIDLGYDTEDDATDYLLDHYDWAQLNMGIIDVFEEKNPGYTVNYYTFATNEEMYNELLKNPNACDLICPSEYMILKMKEENLIKEYTIPQNYKQYGSDYIKNVFKDLGLANEDKAYAIGYMWGTMGLIYNADKGYTQEDFTNWSNLYDSKFSKKITIKDSLRDTYIMAIAIVYEKELLQLKQDLRDGVIQDYNQDGYFNDLDYNFQLAKIFNRTDKETVKKVGDVLIDLKNNLYGFEVDSGKNDLISGKIDVNFAWSGDAVAALNEGDEAGIKLDYAVPEEGSNVWFDGWVMTKNANEEVVSKFLDFICSPDNVIRNMEYIGYTSCIASDEVFSYVSEKYGATPDDEEEKQLFDLSYFFGTDQDYKIEAGIYKRQLFAQYANEKTILRCAVMENFSAEDLELINEMWNEVKLITFSDTVLIIIVCLIVILIVCFVLYKFKDKIFVKNFSTEQNKPRKKGYKVVKIENIDY